MFPRGFNLFTKEPPRPLSHAEYFNEPFELASGLANADVVLASDGCRPLTNKGEIVLVRHPKALSPGTFGSVKGRLKKARAQSSIKSMRWHNPSEEARTISAQKRRNRLLAGMWAGTEAEAAVLQVFHQPIQPRVPVHHGRKPRSSPRPPKPSGIVPQPVNFQIHTPPGLLAFCADLRLQAAPFIPCELRKIPARVLATSTPHTTSAWGASRL